MIESLEASQFGPRSQLRTFLDAAPDAMVIVNDSGVIVSTSTQAELLFGYRAGELDGQQVEVLMPEAHRPAHMQHRVEYARGPRVRQMGSGIALYGRRRDGSAFPVEISLSPIRTEAGVFVCTAIRDVSDRKRAEHAFRTLAAMVESSIDAILSCDLRGTILTWNAAAEAMFGYTEDEAIGSACSRLLPHSGGGTEGLLLSRPDLGGTFETVGTRKDGKAFDVSLSITPLRDDREELTGHCVIARDVSETRRLKDAAEADRARLAEAQELAHVGSFEIDLTTGERWWSDELRRLLGIEHHREPSRELLLSAIHPDDLPLAKAAWARVDGGESLDGVTFRIVRPTGEVRWTRSRMQAITSGSGVLIKIAGTMIDVTLLHLAAERQHEAEMNFRLSFDHSHIGLSMADLEGRLTRINPAVRTILQRSEAEILGKRMRDFSPASERSDDALFANLVANRGSSESSSTTIERALLMPGGEVVWGQETISLVRTESGEPSHFFVQLQDVSARKQAEDALKDQAMRDPLTGLLNRSSLSEKLGRVLARRAGNEVIVLFVDVDKFKTINDVRGHTAGDALLVQIASRLRSAVRPTDALARFGGDEFVVVCEDIAHSNAETFAARIIEAMKAPFELEGQDVHVTVSVGVVVADDADDAEALLRKSDLAMYDAKGRGRTHVAVFDDQMQKAAYSRLETESHLGHALERAEMRVAYQPIVEIGSERTVGFEALVRWQHPTRGLLTPAEFLPIAEESDLILELGEWVLREALENLKRWQTELPRAAVLFMAVNLSARQAQDPEFPDLVASVLASTGIDPRLVHLELTESMVIKSDLAIQNVSKLRGLGLRLSIDDFGTGYSSLSYLHRLPVHAVKIDRSFVWAIAQQPGSAKTIIDAIVHLAGALDLEVVGEGVQTVLQRDELRRLGVKYAQGYLWSPPMPASAVSDWIRRPTAASTSQQAWYGDQTPN